MEHILSKLRKVRKYGRGWMACCPAHDDQSPSLSVKQIDNKILAHCFAGCSFQEIYGAMGLGPLDFFTDRDKWPKRIRELSRPLNLRSYEIKRLMTAYGLSENTAKRMVDFRTQRRAYGR